MYSFLVWMCFWYIIHSKAMLAVSKIHEILQIERGYMFYSLDSNNGLIVS